MKSKLINYLQCCIELQQSDCPTIKELEPIVGTDLVYLSDNIYAKVLDTPDGMKVNFYYSHLNFDPNKNYIHTIDIIPYTFKAPLIEFLVSKMLERIEVDIKEANDEPYRDEKDDYLSTPKTI